MELIRHTAYISVGSNIGDKLKNCKTGIAALEKTGNSFICKVSGFYQTEPVDYTDQDWFINAAVKIETRCNPFQLVKELKDIEIAAGRKFDVPRFGPRILDLDILLYDNIIIDNNELCIPHPRMHKRMFVLKPLCDIDSELIHPVLNVSILSLMNNLTNENQRIIELL